MRLVLGGHQGEFVVRPGFQAGLHNSKRLQQTAELVAPPNPDLIGKVSCGYTFRDLHGGGNRFAHGIGEGDRKHQPDEHRANRNHQHGGARCRDSCLRLATVIEAVGGDRFHKVVHGGDGTLALLRDREGRGNRG
jgi:hypothetical protein